MIPPAQYLNTLQIKTRIMNIVILAVCILWFTIL